MNAKAIIEPQKIWDISRVEDRESTRMELTDLIRFKGHWYCSFREGEIHMNSPSGRGRIIRSQDGEHWESVALFEWEGADVREIKLSVTPEGWLMGNTWLYFVSQNPRFPDEEASFEASSEAAYIPPEAKMSKADQKQAYYQLDKPGVPATDNEEEVAQQSVTWLSQDGVHWSSAYACASGVNFWRWETTWHDGMGYSAGYRGGGEPGNGTLFRTRDGKQWRTLSAGFYPKGLGSESTIAFGDDGTAYCLLRDAKLRCNPKGPTSKGGSLPMFGIGTSPYYTEWTWKELLVDLGEGAGALPVEEALIAPLGGPKMIRLSDGRFLAAARVMFPGDSDGHISLFFLDPATATLQRIVDIDGTTYAGIVEHEGQIWVSCGDEDASAVYLAKVDLPPSIP